MHQWKQIKLCDNCCWRGELSLSVTILQNGIHNGRIYQICTDITHVKSISPLLFFMSPSPDQYTEPASTLKIFYATDNRIHKNKKERTIIFQDCRIEVLIDFQRSYLQVTIFDFFQNYFYLNFKSFNMMTRGCSSWHTTKNWNCVNSSFFQKKVTWLTCITYPIDTV